MGWFHLERYYNKEGAGVYRNTPQKKSAARRFFEIFFRKFTALIRTNLMYVLVSLPLVTGGLAEAGLTYITRNAAREKYAYPVSDFFATIRRTWKQALPAGLIRLAVNALFGFNIYLYIVTIFFRTDGSAAPGSAWFMLGLNLIGMLFFRFVNYYVFMQIITFSLTLRQIYKNSCIFALANVYKNLLIFLCTIAADLLLLLPGLFLDYRIVLVYVLLVYLLIYPAFRSLLVQFTIFPFIKKTMIDPYYEAHPEADRTAMRALNLDGPPQDAVFTDMPHTEDSKDR